MSSGEYVSSSDLSEFVSRTKSIIEQYPQMNEDNTKSKILRDFIEILGWDIAFDAELEYQLTVGTTKNYVDYALSANSSSPVLFIEAKGNDTSLTDQHRTQLHSYLRQTDVDWGLLTNGNIYEIYRRENVEHGVEIRTVAKLELEELPKRIDYVSLLSKESLQTGHSRELAQRIFDIQRAENTLQNEKENIAEQLTEIITEIAGDVVSQEAQTESKEMVDRLIEKLEEQTEDIEVKDEESFWIEVERQTGISRTSDSVEFVENKSGVENYVDFVEFLFERGNITKSDLPIGSGRTRYILNTEKKHKNGNEMRMPREIVKGVFLETHDNNKAKKDKVLRLGEKFGE
ncbi:MAG: type I restriction enzyme HsdR N-terminal domain-containing protein [Halohasta sp.]